MGLFAHSALRFPGVTRMYPCMRLRSVIFEEFTVIRQATKPATDARRWTVATAAAMAVAVVATLWGWRGHSESDVLRSQLAAAHADSLAAKADATAARSEAVVARAQAEAAQAEVRATRAETSLRIAEVEKYRSAAMDREAKVAADLREMTMAIHAMTSEERAAFLAAVSTLVSNNDLGDEELIRLVAAALRQMDDAGVRADTGGNDADP